MVGQVTDPSWSVRQPWRRMVFGPRLARLLGVPDDPPHVERTHRSQRPVRRPFQTGWYTAQQWVVILAVWIGVGVALSPAPGWVALLWMFWPFLCLYALAARMSLRPYDVGVQIYEDTNRLGARGLPRGVRSSQMFVPYGLALGWFVRRGLVSEWFLRESGSQVDDLLAGRLSGPHLYAWWGGIFASDMLNDEGKAFARRYMLSVDEPWGHHVDPRSGGVLEPHLRHRWFVLDLQALRPDGEDSLYAIPDTPESAAEFDRSADRRLARWRRWRWFHAISEAHRGGWRRWQDRNYVRPP
jgi:hypothetical protein